MAYVTGHNSLAAKKAPLPNCDGGHMYRQICDGRHRRRLNKLLWRRNGARSLGGFHEAFMFALTVGILTAESVNDRASNPTIPTLALQY
jgi:hypothetical protein